MSRETMTTKAAVLVLGLALVFSFWAGVQVVPAVLVVVLFCSAVICLIRFDPETLMAEVVYKQILGFVYVPFLLGHLILIRGWHQGATWMFFLLGVIIAGDTAAFYVGKAFGRHKLAPSISPGKTVEGGLGGLMGSVLIGALFKTCCFPGFSWGHWIILLIAMGALGQVGDLFESVLKRSVQQKDSGNILPGHGGLLDRIDASLFAAPTLYYFKTYLM
jgi:phosphatidate cytidylyltransferase